MGCNPRVLASVHVGAFLTLSVTIFSSLSVNTVLFLRRRNSNTYPRMLLLRLTEYFARHPGRTGSYVNKIPPQYKIRLEQHNNLLTRTNFSCTPLMCILSPNRRTKGFWSGLYLPKHLRLCSLVTVVRSVSIRASEPPYTLGGL